jgi:sugar/nucleoside kinase (ribokinase family)
MTATFDVLGFGAAIVDALARVEEDALLREGLVKGTMALIDQQRAETLEERFGPTHLVSGGSAANTCAGIASLGGRAAFVGKVRDDQFGSHFGSDLRATGVAYAVAPAQAGPATARCFILVTPDGERTMNTFLGASGGLTEVDVDAELAQNSDVLFAEGYLWDSPAAVRAFRRAAALAKVGPNRGRVSFTLSDPFCVDRHRREFLDLIRSGVVDLVFANESEIKALYETTDLDTALGAAAKDSTLAVVTLAEQGAVIVSGGERQAVPAYPVEQVVDATGAGDLFAGGFLLGYARGMAPSDAARLGALCASEIISQMGARPQRRLLDIARDNGFPLG